MMIKSVKIILATVIILCGSKRMFAQSRTIDYKSIPNGITTANETFNYTVLNDKLHAFIFYSPECPLSQKYTLTIATLFHKYENKIKFIGVFPGDEESSKQYNNFKIKYKINYPLLKDKKLALVSALNATVTPEVVLLDKTGKVIYQGAIDDWVIKLGKTKQHATVNYLENAIEGLLNNKTVEPHYVKPIGCYIEQ